MKKLLTYQSELICSECGALFTIPRFENDRREKYHIKDLECYKCKKTTKFIELIDASKVKKELEFARDLTEFEQHVYDLLCSNDQKNYNR